MYGYPELLAPVYGWFTERFDTVDLQDAKVLLDAGVCGGADLIIDGLVEQYGLLRRPAIVFLPPGGAPRGSPVECTVPQTNRVLAHPSSKGV